MLWTAVVPLPFFFRLEASGELSNLEYDDRTYPPTELHPRRSVCLDLTDLCFPSQPESATGGILGLETSCFFEPSLGRGLHSLWCDHSLGLLLVVQESAFKLIS